MITKYTDKAWMKHASLLFVDIFLAPKIKIDNELKKTSLTFELLCGA